MRLTALAFWLVEFVPVCAPLLGCGYFVASFLFCKLWPPMVFIGIAFCVSHMFSSFRRLVLFVFLFLSPLVILYLFLLVVCLPIFPFASVRHISMCVLGICSAIFPTLAHRAPLPDCYILGDVRSCL